LGLFRYEGINLTKTSCSLSEANYECDHVCGCTFDSDSSSRIGSVVLLSGRQRRNEGPGDPELQGRSLRLALDVRAAFHPSEIVSSLQENVSLCHLRRSLLKTALDIVRILSTYAYLMLAVAVLGVAIIFVGVVLFVLWECKSSHFARQH
jgi:hypothetical protein